jgi:hypothetical protein
MKHIPSVMKEMPNGIPGLIPGKQMQKDRRPASINGLDVISSAVVPISPAVFHRLFQDNLRVHNQAGIRSASLAVDGQDQGVTVGKIQRTPLGGENELLPLAGTKVRAGKGKLISSPGVKEKTGKKISVEGSLNANPYIAVASPNSPMVDNNRKLALRPSQETTEIGVWQQNSSGKTHDHVRSDLPCTGEYSAVPGKKDGPSKDAAMKMSPLLNASAAVAVKAAPRSLVSDKGLGAFTPGPQQNASGETHDHLRSVLRHTGEYLAVPGKKDGPSKDAAIVEMDRNAKMGRVGDVDDATRRIQNVETMDDQEKRGPSDDSPLFFTLEEGLGKRAKTANEVKTSPLLDASAVAAVKGAPRLVASENGSGDLSPGQRQNAYGETYDHVRSDLPRTGEYSVVRGENSGPIKNMAIVETDGNAKMELPDDAGDMTSSLHDGGTRSDGENTRHVNDSPLVSLLREDSGKRAQAAPRAKTALLFTATVVPAADTELISVGSDNEKGILSAGLPRNVSGKMHNHDRFGHRNTDDYSAVSGEKGVPDKNAAIVEMEGYVKTVHAVDVDDVARGVHGMETRRKEENKGGADASPLPSLFKENIGEQLRRVLVGEKAPLLSNALAVPTVDAASISSGSDNGEGVLSPGRQALLMAEIIDTARPLVEQGGGRIRISLSPPSLGALEIDVRVKKEGVELFVVANNADVQQTLCAHVDQLRKALVEQGLNMDRFQVVVGDRSDGQQGRDPRQEGMSGGHREAWSEKGYHAGLDGDTVNDEMGHSALSGSYPSVGGINLFI